MLLRLNGTAEDTVIVTLDASGFVTVTEDGILVPVAGNDPPQGVTDIGVTDVRANRERFSLYGNGADNRLDGANGNDRANGGGGDDVIQGFDGNDILQGKQGEDIIYGGSGKDLLEGGEDGPDGFDDILVGGRGNDQLEVADPGDQAIEAAGEGHDLVRAWLTYTLPEHIEDLRILGSLALDGFGNARANTMTGNGKANRLEGRENDDVLIGGNGGDTLVGGTGEDVFVLQAGDARGDSVLDMEGVGAAGGDRIELRGFGAGATLSYDSGTALWTVSGTTRPDTFTIVGVTALSSDDYIFS